MRRTRAVIATLAALLVAGVMAAVPAEAAAPTITSFTPTSGKLTTVVTITGANFTAPATVFFGDGATASPVTVASSTRITTRVPLAAATGKITVHTSGLTATSTAPFTVNPGAYIAPDAGPPASTRPLHLSGFGAYEAVDVYFDTTDVLLTTTDGNGVATINLTIPTDAGPGSHWISAVGRRSGYATQLAYTVRTDWPQFGYGTTHHATNPYENVLTTGNVSGLSEAWRTPFYGGVLGSPAIVGGLVYEGFADGRVRAFDEASGAVRWTHNTGDIVDSSPAVSGGVVYVGSDDGHLYALNALTGALTWRYATGDRIRSSPTVSGGLVYVGSFDAKVYALNAATGALAWSFTTGSRIFSSPAVAGGVTYIGSYDGSVYALDATTGAQLWKSTTNASSSSPVVANGRVYVGSDNGSMYALRASTGAIVWSYATGGGIEGTAALADGALYFTSDDGNAYAVTAATGALRWSVAPSGSPLLQPASVGNGVVFVGDSTDSFALAADSGSTLAVLDSSTPLGGPAVVDGTVTIGDYYDGVLAHYTLDADRPASSATRPNPAALRPNRHLTATRSSS